jgi:NAD(P)-dependent dehydrogenase (short-subunit alcohol dehydrogenase family)
LTRGLAVDAPIHVNAVCPGIVLTEHVVQAMQQERPLAYVNPLPIARGASPDEAALALYLIHNAYITGQVPPVDGGGMLV